MSRKKVRITIEVPKLVVKGRNAHRPTKVEKTTKGRGMYNRKSEKRVPHD